MYCQEFYSSEIDKKSNFRSKVLAPFMARKKPTRECNWEPYEGERVDMLADYDPSNVGERQLMIEIDFEDIEKLHKLRFDDEQQSVTMTFANASGRANALLISFELDLTDQITIDNHVGTEGCWEQAVYPLFNQFPREFEATFRIEHDTAILVSVSNEAHSNMPCSYAHSRLVYQFNSQFRKHQVENIFANEKASFQCFLQ
jgi:hypothetical protein